MPQAAEPAQAAELLQVISQLRQITLCRHTPPIAAIAAAEIFFVFSLRR